MRTALAALLLLAAGAARAGEPFVRVLGAGAEVRSGPGGSFRAIARAHGGDSLPVLERDPPRRWYRVRLEDGTTGWVLADEVEPYELGAANGFGQSLSRFLAKWLARGDPSLLGEVSAGGGAAWFRRPGARSADLRGLFGVRAALAWEGRAVGALSFAQAIVPQGSLLFYALEASFPLWPSAYVTPELVAGGGVVQELPGAGQQLLVTTFQPLLDAGAGLEIHVRRAATVRLDYRSRVLFDPRDGKNASFVPSATAALALAF